MRDRVVVITGASSGIGRETALALASRGARLVLVARRATTLEPLAEACVRAGALSAVALPCDVADEPAVVRVADETAGRFGRIDAWVNNAGVMAVGRFGDIPAEVFRRVVETNFFGYVHGARAALRHFLGAEYGVLVNNASILGIVGTPNLSPYVAAKFAVRGFSEVLRQELRGSGVHVCTVMPASIHTPIWSHAANVTGRQLTPVPPVYPASDVARAIVGAIERPAGEVVVGASGWLMRLGRFAPKAVFDMVASHAARLGFGDASAKPTTGNVFDPMGPAGTAAGGTAGAPRRTVRAARRSQAR